MTLDLQGTQEDQKAFSRWLAGFPLFAAVDRFWLEPSGARALILGEKLELDLGLGVVDGALLVTFENTRQKVLGASRLPEAVWLGQVAAVVKGAALNAPASISLTLTGRELRVRLHGWAFSRVLLSAERLILELEPDA